MEIIRNAKGGSKLCLEGFMYTKKYTRCECIRWKCSQRMLKIVICHYKNGKAITASFPTMFYQSKILSSGTTKNEKNSFKIFLHIMILFC